MYRNIYFGVLYVSMCAWSYVYMWAGASLCISVLIKSGI